MTDHVDVASECPGCHKVNDCRSAPLEEGTPPPGELDRSVCFDCGQVAVFTAIGTLRLPTHTELHEIYEDPDMVRVFLGWAQIKFAATANAHEHQAIVIRQLHGPDPDDVLAASPCPDCPPPS